MKTTTSIRVDFSIEGENFDERGILEDLKVSPLDCLIKKYRNRKMMIFPVESLECMDIDEPIGRMLDILYPKLDTLEKIKRDYRVEYVVSVVIKIKEGFTPGMSLEGEIIEFIYRLNAHIDFDIYIM